MEHWIADAQRGAAFSSTSPQLLTYIYVMHRLCLQSMTMEEGRDAVDLQDPAGSLSCCNCFGDVVSVSINWHSSFLHSDHRKHPSAEGGAPAGRSRRPRARGRPGRPPRSRRSGGSERRWRGRGWARAVFSAQACPGWRRARPARAGARTGSCPAAPAWRQSFLRALWLLSKFHHRTTLISIWH